MYPKTIDHPLPDFLRLDMWLSYDLIIPHTKEGIRLKDNLIKIFYKIPSSIPCHKSERRTKLPSQNCYIQPLYGGYHHRSDGTRDEGHGKEVRKLELSLFVGKLVFNETDQPPHYP